MTDQEKDFPVIDIETSQAENGVDIQEETKVDITISDTRADILSLQQLQYEPLTDENREDFWDVIIACGDALAGREMNHWLNQDNETHQNNVLKEGEAFVIRVGNDIVGTVIIENKGSEWWVKKLAVHPKFQGKGYGKNILHFAESTIKERGGKKIALDYVLYDDGRNNDLKRFYETEGYGNPSEEYREGEIYEEKVTKYL